MDSTFDLDIDWFAELSERTSGHKGAELSERTSGHKGVELSDPQTSYLEVGDDFTQPEVASSSAVSMPQSLDDGVEAGYFLGDPEGISSYALGPAYITPSKNSPNPWPPKLVFDLALGLYSQEEVLANNDVTDVQYERLMEMPTFRQELAAQMREQRENGVTYQRKAAIQAETYLLDLDDMVRDREIAAGTRLATIQYVTKVGGLEPKETKGDSGAGATQVNLQINFT